MTDVAAVVAAAAGSRGIGFQGNLVRFFVVAKSIIVLCHVSCTILVYDDGVGSLRHYLYMRQSSYIHFK